MRAILVLLAIPVFAADTAPVVTVMSGTVNSGQLRGALLEGGGAVFKGIPYAQAPVGDLRWHEPQPVKPWAGVRDASSFGAACAQNSGTRPMANSQEDCLFLNVWNSEWPVKTRKPV